MTTIDILKSLQKRILSIFDMTMRYLLIDLKLGHVMWGMGCGMLFSQISQDVPTQIIVAVFVGGFAGMIYCELAERSDREH